MIIKLFKNGDLYADKRTLVFDNENKTATVRLEYPQEYEEWDKRTDIVTAKNETTFKTGDTFTLDRSVLKKGHLQLQPIAYKGDKVKKWKIITLEVQSSLNVLEDTTSIEISVAQDLYDLIDTKQDKIKTKGNPTWENLGLLLKELIE